MVLFLMNKKVKEQLKEVYRQIAIKHSCKFLAASDFAAPSKEDQEHMTKEGHTSLAEAIIECIRG